MTGADRDAVRAELESQRADYYAATNDPWHAYPVTEAEIDARITDQVSPTSPGAMEMLTESKNAALSRLTEVSERHASGEATDAEYTDAEKDYVMAADLLERGLAPEGEREAGS